MNMHNDKRKVQPTGAERSRSFTQSDASQRRQTNSNTEFDAVNGGKTVYQLRSLTEAIKAQKLLRTSGIEARVIRPSSRYNAEGCGYGISVSNKNADQAINTLSRNGIEPLRINH